MARAGSQRPHHSSSQPDLTRKNMAKKAKKAKKTAKATKKVAKKTKQMKK